MPGSTMGFRRSAAALSSSAVFPLKGMGTGIGTGIGTGMDTDGIGTDAPADAPRPLPLADVDTCAAGMEDTAGAPAAVDATTPCSELARSAWESLF